MTRLLALILVLLSGVGLTTSEPESRELEGENRAYVLDRDKALGTVLVVHSVFQDHQTSLPLARALWRSGFRAVVVELQPGSPFSDYVERVKELASRFKKQGKVYAVGHSMGADLICTAASQEALFDGLVAFGFPVDRSSVRSPLLLGAGAWDQVHTRDSLTEAAQGAKFVMSPFSDHSQETLDPYLQRAAVQFLGGEMKGRWWSKVLAQGVFFLSLTFLGVRLVPRSRTRVLLGMSLGSLVLNAVRPHFVWSTLAVSLLVSSAWKSSGESGKDSFKAFLFLTTGIGLSWLLHGYQSVLAEPTSLLGLPVALLSWLPVLACRLVNMLTDPVHGRILPLMVLLLGSEAVRPGLLLGALRRGMSSFLKRVGTLEFQLTQKPGPAQLGLFLLLLLGGALAWKNVLSAGYALGINDLSRLAWKMTALILFPLLTWLILVRLFSRAPSSRDPLS